MPNLKDALAVALLLPLVVPGASAETFRWAGTTDPQTRDPHAVNSTPVYVPLYVQPLVWGVQENITLAQRPDDFFILRWVTVN